MAPNNYMCFLDKSMYADYMNEHTVFIRKYLWKIKVPLKIRIFMCFIYKKSYFNQI
jgi:hypothetical protein